VEVGVAHAAEGDVDLHVVRARRAAGDVHGFEGQVAGVGAIGFDGHAFQVDSHSRAALLAARRVFRRC
jgi:hypothetical protein